MRALRWILVPALAPIGYLVTFLSSLLLDQLLLRLCPAELVVSGTCTASWYPIAEMSIFAIGAAIGAAVWVVLPTLVAPAHRTTVAWIAFASGAGLALWFIAHVGSEFAVPFASALIAGTIVALIATSRDKRAT